MHFSNFASEWELGAADKANPYPPGIPHSKIAARMYEDSMRNLESNPVSKDIMSNLLEEKRAEDYSSWMADRVSKYTACSNVIAKEIATLYNRDDVNFEDWQYLVIYKKFHKILSERGNCSKETITYLIYKLISMIRNDMTLRNLLMISSDEYVEHLLTKFVEMSLNESIYDYQHSHPNVDDYRMKTMRKHLQRSSAAASMAHSASKAWGWTSTDQMLQQPYPIPAPSQLNPENYYVYNRQVKSESQGDGANFGEGCVPVPKILYRQNDFALYQPIYKAPDAPFVVNQPAEKKKTSSKRFGPRGPYKRTLIRMRMKEISQKRRHIKNKLNQQNQNESENGTENKDQKDGQNQSFFMNSKFEKGTKAEGSGKTHPLKGDKKEVEALSTSDRTDESSSSERDSQKDQNELENADANSSSKSASPSPVTTRRASRRSAEVKNASEENETKPTENEGNLRVTRNSRRAKRNAKEKENVEEYKNEVDADNSKGNLDIKRNEKPDAAEPAQGQGQVEGNVSNPNDPSKLLPSPGVIYENVTPNGAPDVGPARDAPYSHYGYNYLNGYPETDMQNEMLSRRILESANHHTPSKPTSYFQTMSDLYGPYTLEHMDAFRSHMSTEPASEELSPNLMSHLNRDMGLYNGLNRDIRLFERRNRDMGLFDDVLDCNLVYYGEDGDLIGREFNRIETEVSPLNKFLAKNPFHAKPLPENLTTRRSTRLRKAKPAADPEAAPLEAHALRGARSAHASVHLDVTTLENKGNASPGVLEQEPNGDAELVPSNDECSALQEGGEKRSGDDTVWDMVQKHHKSSHTFIPSVVKSVNFSTAVEANDDMSLLIREHYHVSENVPSSQTQPYANAYKNPKSVKWSYSDTKRFYNAIETFGTDLLLVRAFLPEFTDRQVYDKFKLEERKNPQLMQNALQTHKSISLKQYEQKHGKIDVNTHYNPLTDPLLREEETPSASSLQLNPDCADEVEKESPLKVDDKIISLFM